MHEIHKRDRADGRRMPEVVERGAPQESVGRWGYSLTVFPPARLAL
jgi:hypothetical protein